MHEKATYFALLGVPSLQIFVAFPIAQRENLTSSIYMMMTGRIMSGAYVHIPSNVTSS